MSSKLLYLTTRHLPSQVPRLGPEAQLCCARVHRARPEAPLRPRAQGRLQPPSLTVTASIAYAYSLHRVRLQPPSHTITYSITYGYSLHYTRLQPPLHTVTASITYGYRRTFRQASSRRKGRPSVERGEMATVARSGGGATASGSLLSDSAVPPWPVEQARAKDHGRRRPVWRAVALL